MELYIYCTKRKRTTLFDLLHVYIIAFAVIKCQSKELNRPSKFSSTDKRPFAALLNREHTQLISTTISHLDNTNVSSPSTRHSDNSESQTNSDLINSSTSFSPSKTTLSTDSSNNASHTTTTKVINPQTGAIHSSDTVTDCPINSECRNETTDTEVLEDDTFHWTVPWIVGVSCGAALIVIITVMLLVCILHRRKSKSKAKVHYSNYWDDSVTLSYINNHIELPRDFSDEMMSLDDDSFLHSLDNMSFTNLWTADGSRRTAF